ncbi:hypothetical protein HKCCE3408_17775 [Rhodobacterales bacterium HKCCE3408]|nr:hypothetical protein [Rhodobacterales bacterium HKCCE3408]
MRYAAALLLALAAPANALTPPACEWVQSELRMGEWGVDNGTGPQVWPTVVGRDFVRWTIEEVSLAARPLYIGLQHCPTGQEILIGLNPANPEAQIARFDEMMTDDTGYTLRQIGGEMATLGASARVMRNELGRCACDFALPEGGE